nr:hypothetical protein [Tanacetum cinerariifolium]
MRSTGGQPPVNADGPPVNGDRWSMVAVNDGRWWGTIVDHRWTTVDHHQTTGQWWLTDSHRPGQVGSWAESGSGLGWVWIGSATWHATCAHVSATCSHVAST